MRIIAIVQARFGSSRLPGKALKPIAGRPMLAHVLARAKAVRGVDDVVLATSDEAADVPLTWVADELCVPNVRGSTYDVLGRVLFAAETFHAQAIIRLTGDCPLLDPAICGLVLDTYRNGGGPAVEFVSNDTTASGYPDGTDCEVFSMRLLVEAAATVPAHAPWVHGDREHVTSWMRRTQPQRIVRHSEDLRHLKFSVDYQDDLERVRRIYAHLPDGDYSLAATLTAWRQVQDGQ